ncbi:hypothetical protein CPC08DRAFT_189092 [Agrocybe pediades]|nr:hypothetical protein CPC08DRAFT_189092 [Agrocybe pediades]
MSAVYTSTAPPTLQLRSFDFYPSGLVSLNDDPARQHLILNKPLPHIPNRSGPSSPLPTKPHLRPNQNSPSQEPRLSNFLSFCNFSRSSTKMLESFQIPPALAALLAYLDWADAYSLFATCKTFREVLKELPLRDVVLSRYVPGYAYAMKSRDMSRYHDVPVSIHDLDLLVISQRMPLHRYPTHALRTLSSLYPTFEDDETTRKLVALSQAHSRFVLLLQSLLHSSSLPVPPVSEPIAELEPRSKHARSPFSLASHFTPRELVFPAPLAYAEETQPPRPGLMALQGYTHGNGSNSSIFRKARRRLKGTKSQSSRSRSATTTASSSIDEREFGQTGRPKINRNNGPRPSANTTLSSMMSMTNMHNAYDESDGSRKPNGRRMSIFGIAAGTRSKISPPPPEEPKTLKEYHDTWRRNRTARQKYYSVDFEYHDGRRDSDGSSLKRPSRRFASLDQRAASSDSSISSSYGRHSPAGNRNHVSPSSTLVSNSNTVSSWNSISSTSQHDLIRAATSRLRAPILRVFVPCAHLDAGGKSIMQCEQQLEEAGLWQHLSTGDVVCNFGYVPMSPEDESASLELGANINGAGNGTVHPRYSPTSSDSNSSGVGGVNEKGKQKAVDRSPVSTPSAGHRKWLVFNGHVLVPYTPPDLVPISNPLSLPSAYYYAHLAAFDNSASRSSNLGVASSPNFTFMIPRMPAVHPEDFLDMRLIKTEAKVPSPHSPMGFAIVKRWAWTARIVRSQPIIREKVSAEDEVGEGWLGEWILEYEGTKEGRQILLDVLAGKPIGKAVWELVKEKSGGGRLWLKLLP